jgi:hypothetical protein
VSHQNGGKYGKNTANFHELLLLVIANAISMPICHISHRTALDGSAATRCLGSDSK